MNKCLGLTIYEWPIPESWFVFIAEIAASFKFLFHFVYHALAHDMYIYARINTGGYYNMMI